MYNQELYNTVLERTHHKYRRVFDKNAASDFTNRDIHPSTRMAMRLHDVFLQETPVILEKQNIVFTGGASVQLRMCRIYLHKANGRK